MLEFMPSCPDRPADWRWQWTKYITDNNYRLTRARSDEYIASARRFIRELNRVTDDADHILLSERYKSLYVAWSLYQGTHAKNNRWEIEARILARQTPEQIALKSIYSVEDITTYCQLFFDVIPRIDAADWVTHVVIGASIDRAFDRQPDGLWKLFGYWGGPIVLDSLIYRFNNPIKPESPKSVAGFLADDIRSQLQTKAMMAIRSMPVDWQTSVELMNLYYRMLELENNTDAVTAGGAESFKSAVSAFMSSIPWSRDNTLKTNIPIVDAIDTSPVGLRAHELLIAGAGNDSIPSNLANITYPPPNTKPAGG